MQFRPKSFWTPRYVTNRLRLALDQKVNPAAPWWPREAARHLDGMLRHGDRCLEWGSGRSTVWLSARTSKVHSVEHDRDWFGRVQELLTSQRLDAGAVELLTTDSADGAEHSPYVRIVDRFGPGEISVFIVDGELAGSARWPPSRSSRPAGSSWSTTRTGSLIIRRTPPMPERAAARRMRTGDGSQRWSLTGAACGRPTA